MSTDNNHYPIFQANNLTHVLPDNVKAADLSGRRLKGTFEHLVRHGTLLLHAATVN